ncbi:IS3 family transposase [Streptomyces xanthophaeus]
MKLTTRLVSAGIQAFMSSVGDSYDNALAENLWMVIKTECIRGRIFTTGAEANLALFEYIDGFYNPSRILKRLGYLSPIKYEEKNYANQAAAVPSGQGRLPCRCGMGLAHPEQSWPEAWRAAGRPRTRKTPGPRHRRPGFAHELSCADRGGSQTRSR